MTRFGWRPEGIGEAGSVVGDLRGLDKVFGGVDDVRAMVSFQTKVSDRWSERLTPGGILDMALRGTEEQWWELYRTACRDAELRELLRRLLERSDPDLEGGRRLWLALLGRMEARGDAKS